MLNSTMSEEQYSYPLFCVFILLKLMLTYEKGKVFGDLTVEDSLTRKLK